MTNELRTSITELVNITKVHLMNQEIIQFINQLWNNIKFKWKYSLLKRFKALTLKPCNE